MTPSILEQFKNIRIIQVGCGGTGSWLVPLVSKFVNNISLKFDNVSIEYIIADKDTVESSNILRQNFNEWDIGRNKAIALTSQFSNVFKDIKYKAIYITSKLLREIILMEFEGTQRPALYIVIGCSDSNKARRASYNTLKNIRNSLNSNFSNDGYIYIDAGNSLHSGQVITIHFGLDEFVSTKKRHINFLKMFPANGIDEKTESCAFFGDQSQSVNNLSAGLIFCNIQKILINSEIPPEMITFTSSGYSTFKI
jgi:molybdopterin/thiamine biosynthesis adenylyltransferase